MAKTTVCMKQSSSTFLDSYPRPQQSSVSEQTHARTHIRAHTPYATFYVGRKADHLPFTFCYTETYQLYNFYPTTPVLKQICNFFQSYNFLRLWYIKISLQPCSLFSLWQHMKLWTSYLTVTMISRREASLTASRL